MSATSKISSTRTRRYRSKRRYYRKPKTGYSYNQIRSIARKELMKEEKKNTELKYYDQALTSNAISSSGTIFALSNMGQGNSNDKRLGQQINPKSILMRFDLFASDSTNSIRLILFKWFDQASPSIATVLENTTWPTLSPLNLTNSRRSIKVIYDNLVSTSISTEITERVGKVYRKLAGKMNWADGTSGSPMGGQLYLLAVSDSSAAPHPSLDFLSRLRFADA